MIRLFLILLSLLVPLGPAHAHKLKVFATVEGHEIQGYAFFVGGGRPQGSSWTAKDAASTLIAQGETDAEGRFRFALPARLSSAITVAVDTHEAHMASITLSAERLGISAPVSGKPPAKPEPPAAETGKNLTNQQIADLVNSAVQKQVEPVLERLEEMDARMKLTDIMSGIFLIIGLAGIFLWVRGKKAAP
ncbi:MAG: cobalamin biosynthesis protein CbiL [Xanthobacter sp.]